MYSLDLFYHHVDRFRLLLNEFDSLADDLHEVLNLMDLLLEDEEGDSDDGDECSGFQE